MCTPRVLFKAAGMMGGDMIDGEVRRRGGGEHAAETMIKCLLVSKLKTNAQVNP